MGYRKMVPRQSPTQLRTSVQKKRDMCQEHHEGANLSCWIPESSPEKGEGLISSGPLLLCCFSGEESQAMKRPSLRSAKGLAKNDTYSLLVIVI
jgi:hypothetical protein